MNVGACCAVCGVAGSTGPCGVCGFGWERDGAGVYHAGSVAGVSYPVDGADQTHDVEDTSFWFAHRARVLGAAMRRFPPSGAVLDVGGGNGFQTARLQEAGLAAALVEPGAAGCRNAVKRGVKNVIHGTLEDLRLKEGSAGGLMLLDVIEHLDDPGPLLVETRRVLRGDGRLYVTVPAFEFLWSDEDEYARHYRRYTRTGLARALDEAGFSTELLTYFFQPLLAPVLLLRALPYRLGRRKGQTMNKSEHRADGLAGRVIERLLASELEAFNRGGSPGIGTSLLAVARPKCQ